MNNAHIAAHIALENIFESIEVGQECECRYLVTTDDAYGTGDSPTEYECNGDYKSCPRVSAIVSQMFDILEK